VKLHTAVGLGLALVSTTLIQLAYLREHDAAAALPALSMRRPLHSLALLLGDRSWLTGFAMETGGFAFYAAALALAPLVLVQSIASGGIGLLAYISARISGKRLARREVVGVCLSVLGLLALAVSLGAGSEPDHGGSSADIIIWLVSVGVAAGAVVLARRLIGEAVALGIAGGLLFSVGDVATKVATQGGARFLFAIPLIAGYSLGTTLIQLGYQRGGALTVAGLATLLTNALPIIAGTVVLGEAVPHGIRGVLRVLAFAAVTVGAILLAHPPKESAPASASSGSGASEAAG
jgi:hypothetical protein